MKISAEEVRILVVSGVIGAIVGGSGITGLLFYFIRKYIEDKLTGKEAEDKRRKEQRMKRAVVDDELQHCQGRLFFWIHKAIVTGQHNGDLEQAFQDYQIAEQIGRASRKQRPLTGKLSLKTKQSRRKYCENGNQ
mgnify:CR=1 FL=1